ncbi:recombinase family protein [Anaerovorax odorimutans]|uniref:recombinase family protein n=1 Tax=Anaerovorax odorimutans TaxID=109327 RepID=UPI0003FB0759|nr:recombinase family protein [Anaerovorax odorimutans]
MKKLRRIEPTKEEKKKLKVAAYCRVSTKFESQQSSIDLQISNYKTVIQSNPQWEYAGVYFDYGSGLRQKGRSNLEKMINKACAGEIDYILTKSLSRLSRNILDTLIIIRKLKERGINMYFENENRNSIEDEAEFAITLSGVLAQEESRNLSENIQWGYQRKFGNGDIFTKYKTFMGYKCEDGNLVIVSEQAEVVKTIFMLYLDGMTLQQIKEQLESQQIKTATGKDVWATYVIQKMLKNEKYKGCTMFQKTFTEDYLTGKRKVNHGERAKYYVEDTHPAIVSKDVFNRVQEEMKRRERIVRNDDGSIEASKSKFNSKYILGNLFVCRDCGASYRRRTERGKVLWRCATRIEKGKDECTLSPTINEEWLKEKLSALICEGTYDESVVKNKVDRIEVCDRYIIVKRYNGANIKVCL